VSWPLALEKRLDPSAWLQYVLPVLAIVIGLLLSAILLSMLGTHPWDAYHAMAEGAFGSFYSLSDTVPGKIRRHLAFHSRPPFRRRRACHLCRGAVSISACCWGC
jgi:hypothetical protein